MDLVDQIADALEAEGYPKSQATIAAVAACSHWEQGGGSVAPETRIKARDALRLDDAVVQKLLQDDLKADAIAAARRKTRVAPSVSRAAERRSRRPRPSLPKVIPVEEALRETRVAASVAPGRSKKS